MLAVLLITWGLFNGFFLTESRIYLGILTFKLGLDFIITLITAFLLNVIIYFKKRKILE